MATTHPLYVVFTVIDTLNKIHLTCLMRAVLSGTLRISIHCAFVLMSLAELQNYLFSARPKYETSLGSLSSQAISHPPEK